jgi:hypothetical protein
MLLVSQVPTAVHGVNVAYLHKNVFVMKFYVGSVLCISTVKCLLYECKYTNMTSLWTTSIFPTLWVTKCWQVSSSSGPYLRTCHRGGGNKIFLGPGRKIHKYGPAHHALVMRKFLSNKYWPVQSKIYAKRKQSIDWN